VRTRRGGLLSASALAALGASVLLVSLIALGLSALADQPRDAGMGAGRREAAAVVVPPLAVSRHAVGQRRHLLRPGATTAATVASVVPTYAPTASPRAATRSPAAAPSVAATNSAAPNASPTASPTPGHGNGKGTANGAGKGKGNGSGRNKP